MKRLYRIFLIITVIYFIPAMTLTLISNEVTTAYGILSAIYVMAILVILYKMVKKNEDLYE